MSPRPVCWLLPVCCLASMASAAFAQETALDRYIAKPDSSYAWKLESRQQGEGQTTFVVALTSQKWRSTDEVDRPTWTHQLTIVRPDQARPGTAFLFIGGGSHRDAGGPRPTSGRNLALATGTNTVVAELSLVPNQPLSFADSPDQRRSEDDLIAYTRVKYIMTGDEEWLVRLAMVKSGVRAMDCLQEFLASEDGGRLNVDKFVVAGGSKRGWTTWLVAAVDPRVTAIVPMVIDALNSEEITKHHYEAYGFFSSALNNYVKHSLFPYRIGTPEYRQVLAIEDPYHYRNRDRLKIPKLLLNASGDQFFLPDNSQFYYGELQQEKHLRYVPNARHNLGESDAQQTLHAFYQMVLDGRERPKYSWSREGDNALVIQPRDPPREVNLWQASNPDARDFRLDVIGKAWTSTPLSADAKGHYRAQISKPDRGYRAFFVELVYDSGGKYPLKVTTEVRVVPDILPFKWDQAKQNPVSESAVKKQSRAE